MAKFFKNIGINPSCAVGPIPICKQRRYLKQGPARIRFSLSGNDPPALPQRLSAAVLVGQPNEGSRPWRRKR